MGTFESAQAPSFQSRVVGVDHAGFRTAESVKVVPVCLPDSVEYPAAPLAFASVAVAVGHCAACVGSGIPPAPNCMFGPPFSPSVARGVPQDVEPFAAMGRPDFFRSVQSRRNAVAQRL